MSGKIWMISDLHLGHPNLALHRGFQSAEEHDELIQQNWNSRVRKQDTVWILGDVAMEKRSNYQKLGQLNGVKKVVLGNHDLPKGSHNQELLKWVNSLAGMVVWKQLGLVLTHCPIHPVQLEEKRYTHNIHGHVHAYSLPDPRYINVSCEAVDFKPRELEEILAQIGKI
jgi:calcineurin-like phosphoesterase family protein